MSTEPKKETSQRGMDCKKPTSSMAVTISLGRVAVSLTAPAHAAHDGLHDTAADREDGGHELHPGAHRHLGGGKAEEVPQGVLRPLDLPEGRGGLEYPHGKKQHQQAIANALQGAVDPHDDIPDIAALEVLRRLGQQLPQLPQLLVPGARALSRVWTIQLSPISHTPQLRVPTWDALFAAPMGSHHTDGGQDLLGEGDEHTPNRQRKPWLRWLASWPWTLRPHLHHAPAKNDDTDGPDTGKDKVGEIAYDGQGIVRRQGGDGQDTGGQGQPGPCPP